MKKTRRKHTKEFKEDAIKYCISSDKTIKDIASDIGIDSGVLSRWVREYKSGNTFPGNGIPKDKEIFELKKEVANLKEERDILKKALAIFSGQIKI